jgi:hypothetical protein
MAAEATNSEHLQKRDGDEKPGIAERGRTHDAVRRRRKGLGCRPDGDDQRVQEDRRAVEADR